MPHHKMLDPFSICAGAAGISALRVVVELLLMARDLLKEEESRIFEKTIYIGSTQNMLQFKAVSDLLAAKFDNPFFAFPQASKLIQYSILDEQGKRTVYQVCTEPMPYDGFVEIRAHIEDMKVLGFFISCGTLHMNKLIRFNEKICAMTNAFNYQPKRTPAETPPDKCPCGSVPV
jgi:hypothetical protein